MLKNNPKILIAIIFVLLIGTVSAELKLDVSKESTPAPSIGNEITIYANLENTGTSTITNIKVAMRTTEREICSKTVSMAAGNKTRVPCKLNITKNITCGQNTIYVNANGGGQSLSNPINIDITGKHYNMVLEPDLPELDEELKIFVKDADGKAVDGAKILLFEVFEIPGDIEREDKVDIGNVYTENGQAALTINKAGTYKIVAEYEREFYCKSVYMKREVLNSFIIHGLRLTYGLDDDFDILVTDKNNKTVNVQVNFRSRSSREYDRYYDTKDNGSLKFNFKQKGFVKGDYDVYFGEDPMEPSTYHTINKKITIAAGQTTTAAPSSGSSAASQTTQTAKPSLKIETIPEPEKIKVGDKITIYVTSDGKAIADANIKISTMFSGVKELKTSSDGKVSYTIERADLYPIHAEKEGYKPADLFFDLTVLDEDTNKENESTTEGTGANTNEEPKNTSSDKEIEGSIPEKSNETTNYNQSIANVSAIMQSDTGGKSNYESILIIAGIIIVLLVIIILLLVIWKLIK